MVYSYEIALGGGCKHLKTAPSKLKMSRPPADISPPGAGGRGISGAVSVGEPKELPPQAVGVSPFISTGGLAA